VPDPDELDEPEELDELLELLDEPDELDDPLEELEAPDEPPDELEELAVMAVPWPPQAARVDTAPPINTIAERRVRVRGSEA
jgi:hypothetical protein